MKYLTKTTTYNGKTITLYSIDGSIWSNRKEELQTIQERLEQSKITAAHFKGESPDKDGAAKREAAEEAPEEETREMEVDAPLEPVVAHDEDEEDIDDDSDTEGEEVEEAELDEPSEAPPVLKTKGLKEEKTLSVQAKKEAPKVKEAPKGKEAAKAKSEKKPSTSAPKGKKVSPKKPTSKKAVKPAKKKKAA